MKICWLCIDGACGYKGYCVFQDKNKVCMAKEEDLEEFHSRTHACRPINGKIYIFTEKEWQRLCTNIYKACEEFKNLEAYLSFLNNWNVYRPLLDSKTGED